MDMPGSSTSSDHGSLVKTLEQTLRDWQRKNPAVSGGTGAANKPASMFVENPNTGNAASPNLHHERVSKCNSPRGSNEKMGPRHGAVGKPRQQRLSSKGHTMMYSADVTNFKALVYEHTSKRWSSPTPDAAVAQPTSPLTPQSIASSSSRWGFMSPPSSPHNIHSSSTSPLSSPHNSHPNNGAHLRPFHLPSKGHAEHTPPGPCNTHHHPHSSFCHMNQILSPNHDTNLQQRTDLPHCASMLCAGTSSKADNVPYSISPSMHARNLSFLRRELGEDVVCNETLTACRGKGLKM